MNSRDLEIFFSEYLIDEKEGKKMISDERLSSAFRFIEGKSTDSIHSKVRTDIPESSPSFRRIREFMVGPNKEYPPELKVLIDRRDALQARIEDCCLHEKLELKSINGKLNKILERRR